MENVPGQGPENFAPGNDERERFSENPEIDLFDELIEKEFLADPGPDEQEKADDLKEQEDSEQTAKVERKIPEEHLITTEKLVPLISSIQENDDNESKEKLLHLFALYVRSIARQYFWDANIADREDLLQEGKLGLLKAAEKCDPYRIDIFKAYARAYIWGYMARWYATEEVHFIPEYMQSKISKLNKLTNELEAMGERTSDEELADILEVSEKQLYAIRRAKNLSRILSLDELQFARRQFGGEPDESNERWFPLSETLAGQDSKTQPEARAEEIYWQENIDKLLSCLDPKELIVIEKRYGEELTWKEIAPWVDVKTSRGARHYGQMALKKMRRVARKMIVRGNIDSEEDLSLVQYYSRENALLEQRRKEVTKKEAVKTTERAQELVANLSDELKKKKIPFSIYHPAFWNQLSERFSEYLTEDGKFRGNKSFLGFQIFFEINKRELLTNFLLKEGMISVTKADNFLLSLPSNSDLGYLEEVFAVKLRSSDIFMINDMKKIEENRQRVISQTRTPSVFKDRMVKRIKAFDYALNFAHTTFSHPEEAKAFGGPYSDSDRAGVDEFLKCCRKYPHLRVWFEKSRNVLSQLISNYDQAYFGYSKPEQVD